MSIIVGDIHGCVEKVMAFLSYKPEEEHVALGDYLDSYTDSFERQLECLHLLLDSKSVLLWGNHDLHYLTKPLFQYPGYQLDHAAVYQDILETNISRFKPAHVAGGWLCTHAGVHRGITDKESDITVLADMFNSAWNVYLKDRDSDGNEAAYRFKSIFKFDFMAEDSFAPTNIKQVHGHDDIGPAEFTNQSCVSLACGNREFVYLFDTEVEELIKLPIPNYGISK
jgi:hypothetical protein